METYLPPCPVEPESDHSMRASDDGSVKHLAVCLQQQEVDQHQLWLEQQGERSSEGYPGQPRQDECCPRLSWNRPRMDIVQLMAARTFGLPLRLDSGSNCGDWVSKKTLQQRSTVQL